MSVDEPLDELQHVNADTVIGLSSTYQQITAEQHLEKSSTYALLAWHLGVAQLPQPCHTTS